MKFLFYLFSLILLIIVSSCKKDTLDKSYRLRTIVAKYSTGDYNINFSYAGDLLSSIHIETYGTGDWSYTYKYNNSNKLIKVIENSGSDEVGIYYYNYYYLQDTIIETRTNEGNMIDSSIYIVNSDNYITEELYYRYYNSQLKKYFLQNRIVYQWQNDNCTKRTIEYYNINGTIINNEAYNINFTYDDKNNPLYFIPGYAFMIKKIFNYEIIPNSKNNVISQNYGDEHTITCQYTYNEKGYPDEALINGFTDSGVPETVTLLYRY